MTAFRCEFFRPFRNLALLSIGLGTLGMIPALWGRASPLVRALEDAARAARG